MESRKIKDKEGFRVTLIVKMDVDPEMEEEFNRWYEQEHIPLLMQAPGVLSARRYISEDDGPKYVSIYEHENEDVQRSPSYQKALETEWTKRIRPYLKNFSKKILFQIYPCQ